MFRWYRIIRVVILSIVLIALGVLWLPGAKSDPNATSASSIVPIFFGVLGLGWAVWMARRTLREAE